MTPTDFMSHRNTRIEPDTARCTRAMPRRGFVVVSLSTGHTVKPMSTAPMPKHAKDNPVPKMRHTRFMRRPKGSRAAADSLKSVRSLDFDQQLAAADVRAQHQGFAFDGKQPAHRGQQALIVLRIAQIHFE